MSYPDKATIAEVFNQAKFELSQLIEEAETSEDAEAKAMKAIHFITAYAELQIKERVLEAELKAFEIEVSQEGSRGAEEQVSRGAGEQGAI